MTASRRFPEIRVARDGSPRPVGEPIWTWPDPKTSTPRATLPSGAVPEAQVSYAFRNSQGVVQAVHDALYSGPDDLPYSPR